MSSLKSVIEKYTHGLSTIEVAYAEELPRPNSIAEDLGADGVAEVFKEVAQIWSERERLDREGEVNCDVLDDYWRAATRLASVIPYQARLFPEDFLRGLSNESQAVRFYCAHSLSKVPFRAAVPHLEACLTHETDQLNIKVIQGAIAACSSLTQCTKEKIAKLAKVPVPWRDA